MSSSQTLDLPEEILEKVLRLAIQSPSAVSSGLAPKSAVLLTCRQWYRIGVPLLYDTVMISREKQVNQLVNSLEHNTKVAAGSLIHSLTISTCLSSPNLPRLLSHCTELKSLDVCMDLASFGSGSTLCDARAASSSHDPLLSALSSLQRITNFTLRKHPTVYLTQPKVGVFIYGLAECVKRWNSLQSIYIAFRLSDDSGGPAALLRSVSPGPEQGSSPAVKSPLTNLTEALAKSPRLESVTTHLPNVWNNVLVGLVGDQNPSSPEEAMSPQNLQRIIMLPGAGSHTPASSRQPTPPPSRPSYSRPSTPVISAPRPIPGHGLGLSLAPSSTPPSRASPSLEAQKNEPLPPAIPSNSLYLSTAARHHPKLMDLIRAGWREAFSSSGYGPEQPVNHGLGRGRAWTWAGGP